VEDHGDDDDILNYKTWVLQVTRQWKFVANTVAETDCVPVKSKID